MSLLSNISKIIEKLIHLKLNLFLTKNNVLYEKQCGFRHNRYATHDTGHRTLCLLSISRLTESI